MYSEPSMVSTTTLYSISDESASGSSSSNAKGKESIVIILEPSVAALPDTSNRPATSELNISPPKSETGAQPYSSSSEVSKSCRASGPSGRRQWSIQADPCPAQPEEATGFGERGCTMKPLTGACSQDSCDGPASQPMNLFHRCADTGPGCAKIRPSLALTSAQGCAMAARG
eukprot:scaffold1699_cov114-Isochrysis_galbana.AAC.11